MRKKLFKVDLTKIEGEGSFPCPKCGAQISPDDETENFYEIIETIMGDDDELESMSIRCKKCSSTLILDGFTELFQEESNVKISEALPESESGYKTYHTIYIDNKKISQLIVEQAQKEDVAAFKRLRNLRIGDPFKGTIIKNTGETNFEKTDLQEIIKAVKKKFKGLKDKDIFIVEVKDGHQNFIGRASTLLES